MLIPRFCFQSIESKARKVLVLAVGRCERECEDPVATQLDETHQSNNTMLKADLATQLQLRLRLIRGLAGLDALSADNPDWESKQSVAKSRECTVQE